MDATEQSQIKKQSDILRGELKTWEKDFELAHGRKATREEIKKNESIKQKYKEYNQLRDILKGKAPKASKSISVAPSSPKPQHGGAESRKRKVEASHLQTPTAKRLQRTPRRAESSYDIFGNYDSPCVVRTLFDPRKKWVSPTPQKEGMYLGLFDATTPAKHGFAATPSGGKKAAANALAQATPSRKSEVKHGNATSFVDTQNHGRTPTSSAKGLMSAQLTTPSKPRTSEGPEVAKSTSSVSFATPAFLKRDAWVDTGADFPSPPLRGPRKPVFKGLSRIMKDLRDASDQAQDEDLDILRELENEREGESTKPKPAKKTETTASHAGAGARVAPASTVEAEDTRVPHLLSAFDDEAKFDSEPDTTNRDGKENADRAGQPRRAYKKKGQKRTTRRVKIRPTRPEKAIPHDVGKRLASESPEPEGSPARDPDDGIDAVPWDRPHHDDDDDDDDDEDPDAAEWTDPAAAPPDLDEAAGIIPFDSDLAHKHQRKLRAASDAPHAPGFEDATEEQDDDDDDASDSTYSSGGTRYRKPDPSSHVAHVHARRRAPRTAAADDVSAPPAQGFDAAAEDDDDDDIDSGSDYTASSGGTRYRKPDQSEHVARVQARRRALRAGTPVKEAGVLGGGGGGGGKAARKGTRKVGALANMNLRRLKLRGKGGAGGGKGRFGGRRR